MGGCTHTFRYYRQRYSHKQDCCSRGGSLVPC
jgi:hypothetical protein